MLSARYETKKILKGFIGKRLRYLETSTFEPEYKDNGTFSVVGPSIHQRKWFAEVTMKDGKIEKVK